MFLGKDLLQSSTQLSEHSVWVSFCSKHSVGLHCIIIEAWLTQRSGNEWDKQLRIFLRIWMWKIKHLAEILFLWVLMRSLNGPCAPGRRIMELALAWVGFGPLSRTIISHGRLCLATSRAKRDRTGLARSSETTNIMELETVWLRMNRDRDTYIVNHIFSTSLLWWYPPKCPLEFCLPAASVYPLFGSIRGFLCVHLDEPC